MREKAKELQRQRMEAAKKGGKLSFGNSGGFGSSNSYTPTPAIMEMAKNDVLSPPSYTPVQ